jgi:hypothetical protein
VLPEPREAEHRSSTILSDHQSAITRLKLVELSVIFMQNSKSTQFRVAVYDKLVNVGAECIRSVCLCRGESPVPGNMVCNKIG